LIALYCKLTDRNNAMRTLVFDTETTGLHNSFIVQLAAVLYDERRPVSQMSTIIMPMDDNDEIVKIPEAVAAIHGITTDIAVKVGILCSTALCTFLGMVMRADRIVAHNIKFDLALINDELDRNSISNERFITVPRVCTMASSTYICKIPSSRGGYKWPKLIEAHKHFLGKEFDGAHDALNDVQACARVLWALEDAGNKLVEA
jgi:DNA polymerase III subunit epsilon